MNTVREELCLLDGQVKIILEVHDKYRQFIENKVKQEDNEVWFDKLDGNMQSKNRWQKLEQGPRSLI